jgi:hypothetical protein
MPVRVRARREAFHSCLQPGDTVYLYTRVKIRIKGESRWRKIPRRSLVPQCDNP